MIKSVFFAAVTSLAMTAGALAQANGPAGNAPRDGGDPRANYTTATGATVPHPGASQGAGTTPMDVGIQRQDDKIQGSICKGC